MSEDYKKRFCETFAKRFEIDIKNKLIDDYWFLLMEEKDKEIEKLNNKLSLIKGIIRTPRALDSSLAYAMVKTQIENVLGSDKE